MLEDRVVPRPPAEYDHAGAGLFAAGAVSALRTEARHLLAIEERGEDVEALYVAMGRVLLLVLPLMALLIGIALLAASAAV